MTDILIMISTVPVWCSAFVSTLYIVTNMDMYEWNLFSLQAVIDYHNNQIKIMEKLK